MAADISYAIFRQSKIRDYANFSKALGHTNREWTRNKAQNFEKLKGKYRKSIKPIKTPTPYLKKSILRLLTGS